MQRRVIFKVFLFFFVFLSSTVFALTRAQDRVIERIYQDPSVLGPIPHNPPPNIPDFDDAVRGHFQRIFREPASYTGFHMANREGRVAFPRAMCDFILDTYLNYVQTGNYPPKPDRPAGLKTGTPDPTNYPYQYAYAVIAAFSDPDYSYRTRAMGILRRMLPFLRTRRVAITEDGIQFEIDKIDQSLTRLIREQKSREGAIPASLILLDPEAAALRLAGYQFPAEQSVNVRRGVIDALSFREVNDKQRYPSVQQAVALFLNDPSDEVRMEARKALGLVNRYGKLQLKAYAGKPSHIIHHDALGILAQFFEPPVAKPETLDDAARTLGLDHQQYLASWSSGASEPVHKALIKGLEHDDRRVVMGSAWAYAQIKTSNPNAQRAIFAALEKWTDFDLRAELLRALGSEGAHARGWLTDFEVRDVLYDTLHRTAQGAVVDDERHTLLAGLAIIASKNSPKTVPQTQDLLRARELAAGLSLSGIVMGNFDAAVVGAEQRARFAKVTKDTDRIASLHALLGEADTAGGPEKLYDMVRRMVPGPSELFDSPARIAAFGPKAQALVIEYIVTLGDSHFTRFLKFDGAEEALVNVLRGPNRDLRRAVLRRLCRMRQDVREIEFYYNLPPSFAQLYQAIAENMVYDDSAHEDATTRIDAMACRIILEKVSTRGRWKRLPFTQETFIALLDSYADRTDQAGDVSRAVLRHLHGVRSQLARNIPACSETILATLRRRGVRAGTNGGVTATGPTLFADSEATEPAATE